jgi:uncharacterized protein (TIGR03435 family)
MMRIGRMGIVAIAVVVFGSADLGRTQLQIPTFAVASVKRSTTGNMNSSSGQVGGGAFSARNQTVKQLLLEAHRVPAALLRGGPGWIDSERFDIDARPAMPVDGATSDQMLQALLIERFKLRTHWERTEVEGYALVTAQRGAKLKLNTDTECKPPCGGTINSPSGRLTSRKVPLSRFATRLGEIVSRPVIDKTGLIGEFDVQLEWAPEPSQFQGAAREIPDDPRPSLFAALEEQLGLRLVPQRVLLDMLVIDTIEHPTPD